MGRGPGPGSGLSATSSRRVTRERPPPQPRTKEGFSKGLPVQLSEPRAQAAGFLPTVSLSVPPRPGPVMDQAPREPDESPASSSATSEQFQKVPSVE